MKLRKTPTTTQKLKKVCDELWSKAIRKRDPVCRWCKRQPSKDAHHIFSRRNMSTRYWLSNGRGLCGFCHMKAHEHPELFREFVIYEIGIGRFEELKALSYGIKQKTDYKQVRIELEKELE